MEWAVAIFSTEHDVIGCILYKESVAIRQPYMDVVMYCVLIGTRLLKAFR